MNRSRNAVMDSTLTPLPTEPLTVVVAGFSVRFICCLEYPGVLTLDILWFAVARPSVLACSALRAVLNVEASDTVITPASSIRFQEPGSTARARRKHC